ncbi:MAG: FAD-dependent oxidoreductase, partial [Brevibacterium aurantiacum]
MYPWSGCSPRSRGSERLVSHVLIIGSGIAGLTTALRLAGRHEVTVVTKDGVGES